MLVRTLVSILYIVIVIGALILQFFFPFLATILLYGLLAWFVASFFVYRLPVMSHPVFRRRAAAAGDSATPVPGTAPAGSSAPLPSGNFGFCLHCGTSVAEGMPSCPACGRPISP